MKPAFIGEDPSWAVTLARVCCVLSPEAQVSGPFSVCSGFLRTSETRQDSRGSSQRAGRVHSTCALHSPPHPHYSPIAVALPGQVLPSLESPSPQRRANNFQPHWTSLRAFHRGGAGRGGQVRRQRSLLGWD